MQTKVSEISGCKIILSSLINQQDLSATVVIADKWIKIFDNLAKSNHEKALNYELHISNCKPFKLCFDASSSVTEMLVSVNKKMTELQTKIAKIQEHLAELEKLGVPMGDKAKLYEDRILNYGLEEITSSLSLQIGNPSEQADETAKVELSNKLKFIIDSIGNEVELSFISEGGNPCCENHTENEHECCKAEPEEAQPLKDGSIEEPAEISSPDLVEMPEIKQEEVLNTNELMAAVEENLNQQESRLNQTEPEINQSQIQ